MPSRPRCGQSYTEGLEFCLYCEYNLKQAPGTQASPQPSLATMGAHPQLPTKRRAMLKLLIAVLIAIMALYILGVIVGNA